MNPKYKFEEVRVQQMLEAIFGFKPVELLMAVKGLPKLQRAIEQSLIRFVEQVDQTLQSRNGAALEKLLNSQEFRSFVALAKRIVSAYRTVKQNGMKLPDACDRLTNQVFYIMQKVA